VNFTLKDWGVTDNIQESKNLFEKKSTCIEWDKLHWFKIFENSKWNE
jgi:hypothetical protein